MTTTAYIRGVDAAGDIMWRIEVHADAPLGCPPDGEGEAHMTPSKELEEFYTIRDDRIMSKLWTTRWWLEEEGIVAYATKLERIPARVMGV
jgi:hypothetical protein